MSLTREECEMALSELTFHATNDVIMNGEIFDDSCFEILLQLIKEHFDNPPLKWEEIKEDMIIWDNKDKRFLCVGVEKHEWSSNMKYFDILLFGWECTEEMKFEENRFYRKQVTE